MMAAGAPLEKDLSPLFSYATSPSIIDAYDVDAAIEWISDSSLCTSVSPRVRHMRPERSGRDSPTGFLGIGGDGPIESDGDGDRARRTDLRL
jgi:hypothetical protein